MKVTPFHKSFLESAANCLVDAFNDDPVFNVLYGEKWNDSYSRYMFRKAISIIPFKTQECILDSTEQVVCCAIWEDPNPSIFIHFKYLGFMVGSMKHLGWALTKRSMKMYEKLEQKKKQHAPTAYYLIAIGTAASAQGKGLGSELIQVGLERANKLGVPCYLESTNPRNVPFYERHGFKTVELYYPLENDPVCSDKGPVITLMVRDVSS